MTKQTNLELFAQLTDAQQGRDDGEMIYVHSGRASLKVKAFNAAAFAARLKNATRKTRTPAELRTYPKFTPGMSTADYVVAFTAANENIAAWKLNRMPANVLPFEPLNTRPCTLYENGALDFDVVEETEEVAPTAAQMVAAGISPIVAECVAQNGLDAYGPAAQAEIMAKLAAPAQITQPASPEYVAIRTAARAARRVATAAIAKARLSSADEWLMHQLEASEPDYSHLVPADGKHSGGVHAAKNIRITLKREFPGVRFAVKSDYSSVRVNWTDGPTDDAVSAALAPFSIGASDSQTDYFYTVSTKFSDTYGGVQYLFTSRDMGDAVIEAAIHAVFGDGGPTAAEWRKGAPWSTLSGHGHFEPSAFCGDEWAWLAMVRRHANGTAVAARA